MKKIKPYILILIFVAFNLFALDKPQSNNSKPSIKIGIILPLTGPLADVATMFQDAAKFALEEAPKNSIFNYELKFEDDALQSAKAGTAAQYLIDSEKVDALISTWSYGGSVVAPIADRNKIIHFATAWDPTIAKGDMNFLHLDPPEEFIAKFIVEFKKRRIKTVSAIGIEESGSIYALNELKKQLTGSGIELVSSDSVPMTENDFRALSTKIRRLNPSIIFLNLPGGQTNSFITQAKSLQIKNPVTGITSFDVLDNLMLAEGVWYVSDSWLGHEFNEKFQTKYNHNRTYGAGNYYDIVSLLIHKYEELGQRLNGAKPEAKDVAAAIYDLESFNSVFGKLSINKDGVISYGSSLVEITGGVRVQK